MDAFEFGAYRAILVITVFAIALPVGSLLGAIFLRLAASLLGLGDIPFVTAFRAVLVSSFAVCMLHFSVGLNHGLIVDYLGSLFARGSARPMELRYSYSPHFFLLSSTFSLLLTAVVFSTTVRRERDESRPRFVDCLTLAALYSAICIAFVLMVVLLVVISIAFALAVK